MPVDHRGLRLAATVLIVLAWFALFTSLTLALLAVAGALVSSSFPLRLGIGGAILVLVAGVAFFLLLYAAAMLIRLVLVVEKNVRRLTETAQAEDDKSDFPE